MRSQRMQDLILMVLIVLGCLLVRLLTGCMSPTHPELNETQMQQEAFIHCFAVELGWEVQVTFTDEHRKTGDMDQAGWATCDGSSVSIWNGWLLGTYEGYDVASREAMRDIAAHEVCHAAGLCNQKDYHGDRWRACYERLLGLGACR